MSYSMFKVFTEPKSPVRTIGLATIIFIHSCWLSYHAYQNSHVVIFIAPNGSDETVSSPN